MRRAIHIAKVWDGERWFTSKPYTRKGDAKRWANYYVLLGHKVVIKTLFR